MRSHSTAKLATDTLSGEIDLRREHVEFGQRPIERRTKPRIQQPFPTIVSGIDADGHSFELATTLTNLSSSGLYLQLPRLLKLGEQLNFIIKFSNGIDTGAIASVLGRVLRVEPGLDGINGFGLAITDYEFI